MSSYRVVADQFGTGGVFETIPELEHALGIVVRESGDRLVARYYRDPLGAVVVEGDPDFDWETWLARGSLWRTVAEIVA